MKEKIRDSAMLEFSRHSYEKASTNAIIKEAGISKGILFYHFPTKRALFDDLVKHACDFVTNRYLNRLNCDESDFIKKCRDAAYIKMRAMQENPAVFSFLAQVYINEPAILSHKQKERIQEASRRANDKLYQNLDLNLLRQDISSNRVLKLIQWSVTGYTEELTSQLKGKSLCEVDYELYWQDFDLFLEDLRKVFYRQGTKPDDFES